MCLSITPHVEEVSHLNSQISISANPDSQLTLRTLCLFLPNAGITDVPGRQFSMGAVSLNSSPHTHTTSTFTDWVISQCLMLIF